MYVRINLCMYVCMYVCIYMYVRIYVCMYMCIYVCMNVLMYVCMYVCMYEYIRMYVCMCVCMYACIYVCTYVCIYRWFKYKIWYVQYQQFSLNSADQFTITLYHALQCKSVPVLNKAALHGDVWMAGFAASRDLNLDLNWW